MTNIYPHYRAVFFETDEPTRVEYLEAPGLGPVPVAVMLAGNAAFAQALVNALNAMRIGGYVREIQSQLDSVHATIHLVRTAVGETFGQAEPGKRT